MHKAPTKSRRAIMWEWLCLNLNWFVERKTIPHCIALGRKKMNTVHFVGGLVHLKDPLWTLLNPDLFFLKIPWWKGMSWGLINFGRGVKFLVKRINFFVWGEKLHKKFKNVFLTVGKWSCFKWMWFSPWDGEVFLLLEAPFIRKWKVSCNEIRYFACLAYLACLACLACFDTNPQLEIFCALLIEVHGLIKYNWALQWRAYLRNICRVFFFTGTPLKS